MSVVVIRIGSVKNKFEPNFKVENNFNRIAVIIYFYNIIVAIHHDRDET